MVPWWLDALMPSLSLPPSLSLSRQQKNATSESSTKRPYKVNSWDLCILSPTQ